MPSYAEESNKIISKHPIRVISDTNWNFKECFLVAAKKRARNAETKTDLFISRTAEAIRTSTQNATGTQIPGMCDC